MATLFLDFENGNDNYAGTSFALLAQGTDGTIVTATFTSVTASFPNDGSLIGQYLSIFNGTIYAVYNITAWVSATSLTIAAISGGTALANQAARQYYIGGRWKNITTGATAVRTLAGDTIRIMGSPAPTSLGQNGVWTSQALQATKAVTASTNATPIAITCTAHGYSTGDTVVIVGTGANIAPSVGTWEITVTGVNTFTLDGTTAPGVAFSGSGPTARLRNNTRVKLTTAVTQNIASTGPGRAAWTASANVTTSLTTTAQKEGAAAEIITISAAFTTGKAAYWTLPSATDLSGYQQVSFWIRSDLIGTIAAGVHELRLCSDTTGDVAVNTVSIPAMSSTSRWMAFTVDLGSNLGSNIQSIAFYVVTDTGAQTILLNNIIACKASSAADSLTLTSLIGKNTTGETFWGIQSINGTRVMLDADTNATPTSTNVRGYYGTSGTVTTWKRETIKLGPAATSSTALQTIQESGTDGSPITYSGGWDRTAMSTQNLETWLDGVNGNGYGIVAAGRSFTSYTQFSLVRLNRGVSITGSGYGMIWEFHTLANNFNSLYFEGSAGSSASSAFCIANLGSVLSGPPSVLTGFSGISVSLGKCYSNASFAFAVSANGLNVYKDTTIGNGGNNSIYFDIGTYGFFRNIVTVDPGVSTAIDYGSHYGPVYFNSCTFAESNLALNLSAGRVIYFNKLDQISENHRIIQLTGVVVSATDQRHTASGISWKMQPTSTVNRNSAYPLILSLAKVACSANNLVTIKAWMYRDNAGLTMRLVCKGGQLAGVPSDVVSALSTTNAWEEETITFTPTETGVVEITAEAWGGTTFSGWVDDMTISQA